MSLCFRPCIAVRHWLLLNAKRLSIRPSVLLTVLLVFTKDPFPYIRRVSLDGLSNCIVSEDRGMIEGCYCGAVELLSDMEDCVRRSAVRAVSEWGQLLVAISEGESKRYWSDTLFEQLCSIVRDMSMVVRLEAFDALAKIEMVSEDILLLTLSKKVNKHIEIPAPGAVGAFVHGLEDEYYEGRRSACSSLHTLSILSSDFACKALNLLVDVLNDDSIVVRLQALETMHHMAKFGHLKLQEAHLDMFLGTLVDTSTSIRSAARKIIRLTKLHNSAMFKLCVSALVENLKMNPQDEAEIFSVLFNIGRSHGSYAVSIVEEVSQEIDLFFEGRLGFDSVKTASLLVLAISTPLSHEKHICRIPPRIFSYAVTLLGRISRGLADVMNQNTLLSYLCSCSRSTFVSASELFKEEEPLQQIVNDASRIHSQESWEVGKIRSSHVDDQQEVNDEGKALVKLILANLNNIWQLIQFGCMAEVLRTLRSWKEELETFTTKASQSSGGLVFTLKYLRIVKLLGKVWTHFMSPRKLRFIGTEELGIELGKLDKNLREMKHTFIGLNKEVEMHILELILVTCTLKLSSFELSRHQSALKKLYSTISCVELLLEEGSIEASNFVIEIKKSLLEIGTSVDGESEGPFLFKKLLEFFSLKQVLLTGGVKHVKAELDVVDNDCENPLSYVSGLPIGIPLQMSLYNMVGENRVWVRMRVNKEEPDQFVYVDLKQFGGCDEIEKLTLVAPFYRCPKAKHFTLRVSIGMECLPEDDILLRNYVGPKHELAYLCKEKQVHLSMIVK